MYAVVKISGKQYKVNEGDILEVSKITGEVGKDTELNQILMLVDQDNIQIGQPTVEGAKIKAQILGQIKGDKLRVARYKSKVRYRKVKGFRPLLSRIKIEKILAK